MVEVGTDTKIRFGKRPLSDEAAGLHFLLLLLLLLLHRLQLQRSL